MAGLNPDAPKSLIDLDLDPQQDEHAAGTMLVGGATTFHSNDKRYRLDVHPKAGRVLIFQQKGLLHSGEEVSAGVKYTMRSDLMYQYLEADDDGGIVFG